MSIEGKKWAKTLETSDLGGSTLEVFHKFRPLSNHKILRAVRSAFIIQNMPTFTNVKLRLHAINHLGLPGKLIAENIGGGLTPAQITTMEPVAFLDTYWEFDYLKLRKDVWYAWVPYDPTYVKTSNSHLAWVKDFPDKIYPTNNPISRFSASVSPYVVSYITAGL